MNGLAEGSALKKQPRLGLNKKKKNVLTQIQQTSSLLTVTSKQIMPIKDDNDQREENIQRVCAAVWLRRNGIDLPN